MKRLIMAAAMLTGLSFGATASTTFDFTDAATFGAADGTSVFTASKNGIDIRITTSGGDITFNKAFDGSVIPAGLAGDGDGLGINRGDDEISEGRETLFVEFTNKAVDVISVGFLDLFVSSLSQGSLERAVLIFSNGTVEEIDAIEPIAGAVFGGFRLFDFLTEPSITANPKSVTSIAFIAKATNNDGVGVGDFALASLTVAPIPEPATWLLMISGFAVMAVAVRRRRVSALSA